jgi:D-hexose-6-phosphate mutarotase
MKNNSSLFFLPRRLVKINVWELSHYAKQHPTASTRIGLNNLNKLGCAQLCMRFIVVINQQLEISIVTINNQSVKVEHSTYGIHLVT